MGKRRIKKIFLIFASVAMTIVGAVPVFGDNIDAHLSELRIEGVTAELPDVCSYCYFETEEQTEDVKVSYGNEELSGIQVRPYDRKTDKTDYYMMLDISGSIREEHFEAAKAGVLDFQKKLGKNERMTLITFGNQVEIVGQDLKKSDNIQKKIKKLSAKDHETHLYEAVYKAAEMADRKENALHRKVFVVVTDGEDFAENAATQKEVVQLLREKRIPMYTMVLDLNIYGQKNTFINETGAFARNTGGESIVFSSENGRKKLAKLKEQLTGVYVVGAIRGDNRLSHKYEEYTITTADGNSSSVDFLAEYSRPDQEEPIAKAQKISDSEVQIDFSEKVKGADQSSNYNITLNGDQPLAVYSLRTEEDNGCTRAVVAFENKMENGGYRVAFSNITDISMEENKLTNACEFQVTDGVTQSFWDKYHTYIIVIGACAGFAVVVIILLIVLAVHRRKAMVTVEGKAVLKDKVNVRHHIRVKEIKETPGHMIDLYVAGAASGDQPIRAEIKKSLIVGRSDICDVYIDDPSLSRQHFVIYDREDGFYLEDLNTTNGTMLNNRRILTEVKLARGDKIGAGKMVLTIDWA